MWLIALLLFWAVLLLLVAVLQRSRGQAFVASGTCPACKSELRALSPDIHPRRTWEVLACPTCNVTTTAVQGLPGQAAWCPQCRQRALELDVQRLQPLPHAPIRVEVTERCHLCSHDEAVPVEDGGNPGNVIPFPGRPM